MEHKDNWIDDVMSSGERINRVPVPASLMERLNAIPSEIKATYDRIPKRTLWLAAASIGLLIALNLFSALSSSADEKSNAQSEFADTYFSHSKFL